MNEAEGKCTWKQWVEHWRFSNQTSFRIPELLESVRWDWMQLSDIWKEVGVSNESILFVRNLLLSSEDEKDKPRVNDTGPVALSQFTQSNALGELFSTDQARISEASKSWEKEIKKFGEYLLEGQNLNTWEDFLKSLVSGGRSFNVSEIDIILLGDPKQWRHLEPSEYPSLAGSLYLVFSNMSHKGYLADNLNEWHLKEISADCTLGYLLTTNPKDPSELPTIDEAWRLCYENGQIEDLIPKGKKNISQNAVSWASGESRKDVLGSYSDLLEELWLCCNTIDYKSPDDEDQNANANDFGVYELIHHIIVPVYAWSSAPQGDKIDMKRRRGGFFLGWAFHRYRPFSDTSGLPGWPNKNDSNLDPKLFAHVRSLSLLLEDFASNYLIGETEWALEREWQQGDDASDFMVRNFYHSCGWICEKIEVGEIEGYFKWYPQDCYENGFLKVDLIRKTPTGSASQPKSTSLVAHLKPNSLCLAPAIEVADLYHSWVAEKARQFYDRCLAVAEQRQAAEKQGQQSGFLASAHDYSKDIGSVLLRFERFKEDLVRTANSVTDKAKLVSAMDAPAGGLGSEILEDLRSWTPPYLDDSFANTRFTNAHLQTQTRGVLIDEPTECVARLEGGTLREIDEIVRILVWHPIPFPKLKEKESEYTLFAPEKLRHPSTWWNLFTFDLDPPPGSEDFHTRLGKRLQHLILDEKIDRPAFAQRFHIPRICPSPGVPLDVSRSILWPDTDPSRWRPLKGLLPLFVFSMRFAFQCLWAKTLLEEPDEPFEIRIEADASQHRKYELSISFPSPMKDADVSFDNLPYAGEWRSQIRHYTDSQTAPWKVEPETNSVTPTSTEGGNTIRIRILASI